jgi:zinc protease
MTTKNLLKSICILVLALTWSLSAVAQTAAPAHKQSPPEGGPPKAFHLPARQAFTLPNGLKITMVPYGRLPKVTVAVFVRAGSLNEGPEETWMSDFVGRMIKEGGTTTRSAEAVAQQAASMGGSIDVNAGADQTQVALDVLSEFGPRAVALLADVVEHPLFPESDLPRMKQDAERRLAIAKSQSQPLAREQFMKALYPDHPYGRVFPTEEMISKYSIADVKKFYASNFGAARSHIYVAGKFDPAAMKKAITDTFSGWPKGPDPVINIPKPVSKREFSLVDRPNATQSTVYVGLPTVYPGEPDYIPLSVTNTLLGGSFASRITSNIREQKGYTYSPFSQLSTRYHDAFWAEVADVTTAVTGPSLKEIFYEISRLQKEAPSAAELKGIQDYIAGIFILQNSSRQGIIAQLAFADLNNLGDDYLETYVKKVYAVTPEQVQQMAQKHLSTDKMTIVVVGDKSKIADQIAPYEHSGQ